ncbi:multidrug effflux MFS transporter [Stigmatella sp. ncwal1]|uniref:Multidrug effflux MFS transporter n=1 Tax=Stigmatella ashevillensis TaxID=2995309 RepID=A0ABT5DN23_9BACT|nr:multidrug effflux MFS transporter [Stigmatella ashevillena]MDC0714538.1 multidrug effflux MFS transporter [Stigmatella ashevillena]
MMTKISLSSGAEALDTAIPPRADTSRPHASGVLLAILATLAALGTLATNILLPSLPSIARDLGIPTSATGAMVSAFFATFAVGQLAVGPLSDRFGRRSIVLGGLAVFLVGSLACALATTLPLLVAGRVVQALGVCAASVLSRAIARDLFEGAALGRVLAFTMVAMAAAPGFSPLLGGALDQTFGWRSAFVAVALFGLAVAAAYALFIGETHHSARTALDARATALGYAQLITDRRFIVPAATTGLITSGLFAMFTASPAVLMDGLGLSSLELGLFFAGTVFVVFGAGMGAPRLAARWGALRVVTTGLVLAFAGGALLTGLVRFGAFSLPVYLLTVSVFLFGMGLTNPLATSLALSPFGARAGLASALIGFLQMAGATAGAVAATATSLPPVMALGWTLTLASAAALALFTPTARR